MDVATPASGALPWGRESRQIQSFLDSYFYSPQAYLIDQVTGIDLEKREVRAIARTDKPELYPFAAQQLGDPQAHPRHVSGPELLMISANLGCLHAHFIHGCLWKEGWVGFGNRIHQADFHSLADLSRPLELVSRETKTRVGTSRIFLRMDFRFTQGDQLIYAGDQSALFIKRPVSPAGTA